MKLCLLIFCILLTSKISSQETNNGLNLVTNFTSFDLGFAYPLITRYHRSTDLIYSDFNYGLKTGFVWGRLYNSGYSISFTPSLIYVGIPYTVHKLFFTRTKEIAITYHNVSMSLPVLFEKRFLFNGRLGAGLSIALPIWSTGKYNGYDIDISFLPMKEKSKWERDRPYPRLAFLVKTSFPLFNTETSQNFISFEYFHYLHYNRET